MAQVKFEITFDTETQRTLIFGPVQDKIFAYGVLMRAMDAVREQTPPAIIPVRASLSDTPN